MTRTHLPESNIELVTNGDPLNLKRLNKLFENGLNKILISAYDDEENAIKLENLCIDAKLKKNQFIVRHRYYSKDKDFGITLSNRAGLMENAEFKIKSLEQSLKNPCYIPSYTFFLDYQGDVLMCPHDWGKKIILGNLNKEKLIDIWFSKKSMNIRKLLNKSNRNFTPCNVCDVEGTFMGKKNSQYFSKFIVSDDEPILKVAEDIDEEALRIREVLQRSIDEMELSVRSHNCLKAAGIDTIMDLVSKEENQMLKYKNFGRKSLSELIEKLDEMQLSFGMEVDKYFLETGG